jgi:hypothetical protein
VTKKKVGDCMRRRCYQHAIARKLVVKLHVLQFCVWVSNMNNILNMFVNFEVMKMCLDVEYYSDSF